MTKRTGSERAVLQGGSLRQAWVEIDLDAIKHNAALLAERASPAELLAVVKADGYGHGATPVARAALECGASWLGVALVEEGIALREAGIDAPILVLSEPPVDAAAFVVTYGLTPVVYTQQGIEELAKAVAASGSHTVLPVHLKVDTGMHRVGCAPEEAPELARLIVTRNELEFQGLLTHFAAADEPDRSDTDEQVACFETIRNVLRSDGLEPLIVHVSNSAGLLAGRPRYDLVRCGIALYGISPSVALDGVLSLRPAFTLKTRVAFVKKLDAGARISYGLRYELESRATIATIPVGYADGIARRSGDLGAEVLVRGRRRPIVGTVTMDQLMIRGEGDLAVGDEVVLIGRQGHDEITAVEWADRLGTISYEVVCGINTRVPRRYVADRPVSLEP